MIVLRVLAWASALVVAYAYVLVMLPSPTPPIGVSQWHAHAGCGNMAIERTARCAMNGEQIAEWARDVKEDRR